MSELGEQIVRLSVLLSLTFLVPRVTAAWRAALPAFAGLMGEGVGLIIVMAMAGRALSFRGDPGLRPLRKELWALSLPMMLNRLSHTGLRTLSGLMIPKLLMASGLSHSEAVSRLGMLNGMVMPLMFLPGLLAGSLAVVGGPAAARCKSPRALRRLCLRTVLPALMAGLLCAAGIYVLSPFLAMRLYRLPELAPLMAALCPMAVVLPVQQVLTGLMTGLGMQKQTLAHSLLGAAVTLIATWRWTPVLGVIGAGYASLLGHGLALFCAAVRLGGKVFRGPARMMEEA